MEGNGEWFGAMIYRELVMTNRRQLSYAEVVITQKGMDERSSVDTYTDVGLIDANTDFLVLHGTADTVIPLQDAQDMHEALIQVLGPDRATLVLVPDADHSYTDHRQELQQACCSWLGKHMPHASL